MSAGMDPTVVASVLHAMLLLALFVWVARPPGNAAGPDPAANPAA
jgi:hypothetical protein